jgi:ubiquinone/menaquinone biosynthesis C-methylase UbiE
MENKLDESFWKEYFDVYDVLNYVIPYRDLMSKLVDLLEINQGEKILEAGCGTGNLCVLMKNKGAEVVGFDSVSAALDKYKKKDTDARVVLGDLTDELPFSDSNFDKIACNNTIYTISVEKRLDLFKEFYRILKPGGKIVVSNIKIGFSPIKIYLDHIRKSVKTIGFFDTIRMIIKMIFPTIKMFNYNSKIKKANTYEQYSFVTENEQKELLKQVGFRDISINYNVYSNQGIANTAIK